MVNYIKKIKKIKINFLDIDEKKIIGYRDPVLLIGYDKVKINYHHKLYFNVRYNDDDKIKTHVFCAPFKNLDTINAKKINFCKQSEINYFACGSSIYKNNKIYIFYSKDTSKSFYYSVSHNGFDFYNETQINFENNFRPRLIGLPYYFEFNKRKFLIFEGLDKFYSIYIYQINSDLKKMKFVKRISIPNKSLANPSIIIRNNKIFLFYNMAEKNLRFRLCYAQLTKNFLLNTKFKFLINSDFLKYYRIEGFRYFQNSGLFFALQNKDPYKGGKIFYGKLLFKME